MSFLAPLALIGLSLIVPVLLLYMLRLRRREVVVSSTFLWQQVLRDSEANTPWQRLRRNLLLIIQIGALILLVLALARPFAIVPALSAARTLLLIDASLSMNAEDSPDGTRLDQARARAREIIETLSDGAEASILRVGDSVEVVAPYTADRAALLAALDRVTPGVGGADWDAALTLAAGTAGVGDDLTVVVISDGGTLDGSALPRPPGRLQYVRVGASGDNAAIAALSARALPGGPPQVFAQIANYAAEPIEVIFDVRVDGALFAAERLSVPAQGVLPFTLPGLPDDFTTLQAGITRPVESTDRDHLPADDSAYAVAPTTSARRVLLLAEGGNLFLEQALRALPGVALVRADPAGGIPTGPFDLILLDGWLPDALPPGDLLIVNPPASTALFTLGEPITAQADPAALADLRLVRANGAGVDLSLVEAAGGLSAVNLAAFRPLRAAWAAPLAEVRGGPIIAAGTVDARQVVVFAFDLRASDLPLQIAFPALMAALLDWYTPADSIAAPSSSLAGEALPIRLPIGAAAARVTLPDGTVRELVHDRPELAFAETMQPGLYRVEALDGMGAVTASAWTAINVFRAEESDIRPREVIRLGDRVIGGVQAEETGQREFWPWLAALALFVIVFEWVLYQRRQRAPVRLRPLTALRQRR
jgi:hypothetical protein